MTQTTEVVAPNRSIAFLLAVCAGCGGAAEVPSANVTMPVDPRSHDMLGVFRMVN